MPPSNQHLTVLEITHTKTLPEIASLQQTLSSIIPSLVNITSANPSKRARLIKPLIGYDASALALSFVPADGEGDSYTYHHLRRDVFALASEKVKIESRYIVPSAHLTVGRFITTSDFSSKDKDGVDTEKMAKLVGVIEEINEWLVEEYWPKEGKIKEGGEWIVGEGKGLDCRFGTLWYGGGESIMVGEGF
jgi:hypothetical protein